MKRTIFKWLRGGLKAWRKRNKTPILAVSIAALCFVVFLLAWTLGEGPPKGQRWFWGMESE